MWRSVGVTFDSIGDNEALVYLSAFAGGPKLQVAYKQAGAYVYPPEGAVARPVALNKPVELTMRVRGSLVNVAIDGKHVLAYRLPVPRKPGKLELITFDASAEFLAFELAALPVKAMLVEAGAVRGKPPVAGKPKTVAEASAAVVVAEKSLAWAEARPAALRAQNAADRARFATPPAVDAQARARAAAIAERKIAVADAEARAGSRGDGACPARRRQQAGCGEEGVGRPHRAGAGSQERGRCRAKPTPRCPGPSRRWNRMSRARHRAASRSRGRAAADARRWRTGSPIRVIRSRRGWPPTTSGPGISVGRSRPPSSTSAARAAHRRIPSSSISSPASFAITTGA